jgi:hypothetical protein
MTIKEWLTPDFFAFNVILIAITMNLVIYAVVSNFIEDFHIRPKIQTGIYFTAIATTLAYAVMVVLGFTGVMSRFPYLYENKFNFLLLGTGPTFGGNGPVFIAILIGAAIGVGSGFIFGENKKIRIASAVSALASQGLVVLLTILWIVNQT